MSDANREVGINIKTTADLAGAKETTKELGNVEKATKESSKANEQAEAPAKKLTEAKGRLREALKGLALEFPQLARVMSFVTSPFTILTAAVGVAASKFVEFTRSVAEAGRKQAELENMRSLAVSLATIFKEMDAAKFSAAIIAIGDAAAIAVAELAKLNAKLDETGRRADALEDLEADLKKQEIRTKVAKGEMSPAEARAAEAEIDNKLDEGKAQREFRGLRAKKKNQEDALRDLDPQIARLEFTPEGDIAKLKKRVADQSGIATAAENYLKDEGGKVLDQKQDAEAALTAFRKGIPLSVKDIAEQKYGAINPFASDKEVEARLEDFIEGKQREHDAMVKQKTFEKDKATDLQNRLTHATQQNAQIERLRGTEDQLRQGIKDTDDEIKNTTQFNRRALQIKRGTRALGVEEFQIQEQKKEDKRREQEMRKGGQGAAFGGAANGGLASADTSGLERAATTLMNTGSETNQIVAQIFETNQQVLDELHKIAKRHSDKIYILGERITDVAAHV
jgi:hypothetical protein